jgi:hypothetical protein
MRLSAQRFNRHLGKIGQQVRWRKSFACPCVNPHSGGADMNCPHCHGHGRSWEAPIDGVVGVAGARIQQAWAKFGQYEDGDVVLTVPSSSPVYAIGEYDRILLLDNSAPFTEVLTRGQDRLRGEITHIERVFWLDGGDIVEADAPTVAADGSLSWSGPAPPLHEQYSVRGSRAPEYYHFKNPFQDRQHHQGVDLPRRVVVRTFDLYGR